MQADVHDEEYSAAMARAVADEINVFKRDPRRYAKEMSQLANCFQGLKLTYPDSGLELETAEGVAVLKECLNEIISLEPQPAVMFSQAMSRSCMQHVLDMQANDFTSHIGSSGSTPEVRLARVGEHREQCGENIVFGMLSAKEIVYHMLMDDGAPERGHRANLLNADFHFVGVGFGRHPSSDTSTVVLFADHFKAKQATRAQQMLSVSQAVLGEQPTMPLEADAAPTAEDAEAHRAWDRLMEELKPQHLAVPSYNRDAVLKASKPKLYMDFRQKVPRYCVGSLQPKPGIDPSIVRAFVHRVDKNHDDCLEENDLLAVAHQSQLLLTFQDLQSMFDEILERRHPAGAIKRVVNWAEIYAAICPEKRWIPVVDVHVEREGEEYQLTLEAEALSSWCNEVHLHYAPLCDQLAAPPRPPSGPALDQTGTRLKPLPRNVGAAARVGEINRFIKSVLNATVTKSGAPLRDEPKVRQLLRRPGMTAEDQHVAGSVTHAVCMNQRRLWAHLCRTHRESWLKLIRAVGLNPQLPMESKHPPEGRGQPIDSYIQEEIAKIQSLNKARPDKVSGLAPGQEMRVAEPKERVKVRSDEDKAAGQATLQDSAPKGPPPPWEDKRQQTETLVNRCIMTEDTQRGMPGLDSTQPQQLDVTMKSSKAEMAYSFEARRQFQQVLAKQQRASDERRFFAAEKSGGRRMAGSRSVGPSSLNAPGGVRGHFHNSNAVGLHQASHGWPQSLDVRWDGSHIDHTRAEELRPNPKMSKMDRSERAKQFNTYVREMVPDCFEAKVKRSVDQYPDAQTDRYKSWSHHEFRDDVPQRYGKYGRRAFDPQVRERHQHNPHGLSEIDTKPVEDFNRQKDRVEEFLDRSLPPGQARHFKQYMPSAEKPHKYEDMVSREQVNFHMDGGIKKTAMGYGQNRHSDGTDYRLYTRPLHAGQMDRQVPMA
eukprot:TRINITY_DN60621_c0_g1_i1.p1 TRINITY_DN60621_c0_g1~~TRINITY_DN60621_c0_g1_i1.p1  ORF type:complete len:959 (+),score=179.16 TRINITY_DN60621_c0_g1_i1:74-2878(+)